MKHSTQFKGLARKYGVDFLSLGRRRQRRDEVGERNERRMSDAEYITHVQKKYGERIWSLARFRDAIKFRRASRLLNKW